MFSRTSTDAGAYLLQLFRMHADGRAEFDVGETRADDARVEPVVVAQSHALAAPVHAGRRLTLDLPDLAAWPKPADKIRLLLGKAAEVEHALMVQYLYSAYSLKSPTSVGDPQQQAALRNWRSTVAGIAREEMGHLMTVQNLRLLVGLPRPSSAKIFQSSKGFFPSTFTSMPSRGRWPSTSLPSPPPTPRESTTSSNWRWGRLRWPSITSAFCTP